MGERKRTTTPKPPEKLFTVYLVNAPFSRLLRAADKNAAEKLAKELCGKTNSVIFAELAETWS